MDVKQYIWNVVDSNSWLICVGHHGLLVDAVYNEDLFNDIKELEDLTIILTHSHFDHIIGLNKIRDIFPQAVVVSTAKCSEYLGNIYRNMSSVASSYLHFYENGRKSNITIEPFICQPSKKTFETVLDFCWHGYKVLLKSVFGHSDDGLIVIMEKKYLFSGDTLLNVPTITRFLTGSRKRFHEEDIPFLSSLTKIEEVYPGHGEAGKIEKMLKLNM